MSKQSAVSTILQGKSSIPKFIEGYNYAPANIALVKYWGKRDAELNLPVTPSLSISLGNHGTSTKISMSGDKDILSINGEIIADSSNTMQRLTKFLDLFRQKSNIYFKLECLSNIPIAAGLASSSSAFASIVKALDKLFAWELNDKSLSILARIGSGSACRSLFHGFVQWDAGIRDDGMDSYAKPLDIKWEELNIGLVICSTSQKEISSRDAMALTMETSLLYKLWPEHVKNSMLQVVSSIKDKNFESFGSTVENNALTMHATMLASNPAICYFLPQTMETFHKVWELRKSGVSVYLTQDAGPNVKLLFRKQDSKIIKENFKDVQIIEPFLEIAK